jgi:hypothetical protein
VGQKTGADEENGDSKGRGQVNDHVRLVHHDFIIYLAFTGKKGVRFLKSSPFRKGPVTQSLMSRRPLRDRAPILNLQVGPPTSSKPPNLPDFLA